MRVPTAAGGLVSLGRARFCYGFYCFYYVLLEKTRRRTRAGDNTLPVAVRLLLFFDRFFARGPSEPDV